MATPPIFSVGQTLTSAQMSAVGLWRITGCTVSSTGGTAATASNGVITMGAGNTSVTIVNAFNADFDDYLIAVSAWGTIAGAALYAGVKTAAGVQNGANWKGNALYVSTGTSGAFSNGFDNNTTSTAIGFLSVTNGAAYVFNINSPYLTQRTTINFNNADADYWRVGASVLQDNVSYPSIIIAPNAGTISGGTVRVYGYTK